MLVLAMCTHVCAHVCVHVCTHVCTHVCKQLMYAWKWMASELILWLIRIINNNDGIILSSIRNINDNGIVVSSIRNVNDKRII